MTWIRRRPTSILDVGAQWHLLADGQSPSSAFQRGQAVAVCGAAFDPEAPDVERSETLPLEPTGGLHWELDQVRSRLCAVCRQRPVAVPVAVPLADAPEDRA